MVRVLLISDIHSNKYAFEQVLRHATNIDRILCAGDIVGYNPYPNECVQMVRELNMPCVMGNHDWASVLNTPVGFNPYAQAAVYWTHEQLTKQNLQFLSSLSQNLTVDIEGLKLSVYHGSPRDPLNEYVLPWAPKEALKAFLDQAGGDLLILGHTHIPMAHTLGDQYVLNPGSVGQPRSGNPNSSYMVLDIAGSRVEVEHHLVEYDIDAVAQRIIEVRLPHFLAERLYHGV